MIIIAVDSMYGGEVKNPVAYCPLHHKVFSIHQLKVRKCLERNGKQCIHLQRYEHPFWSEREAKKEKRKKRKARLCE